MKNQTRDFARLTTRVICAGLLLCAWPLLDNTSIFGQTISRTQYDDDTYGPHGIKTIEIREGPVAEISVTEFTPPAGTKIQEKRTEIEDPNEVLREEHLTTTDLVTKKTTRQLDEYYDCKGKETYVKDVRYDAFGNEIYREEERYKDGKQTSGHIMKVDAKGKKTNEEYDSKTGKYGSVAFEGSSEISTPERDTSVCPVNTYANQIVGGFNLIREDSNPDNFNTYGANLSFTHFFERDNTKNSAFSRVGVTADFNVNFRKLEGVDLTKTSVLGGVTFRPFPSMGDAVGKANITAQFLFGVSHLTSSVGSVSVSDNSFTMKLGGALDVNVTPHFFIRPIGVDYAPTFFGGNTQNNVQFTFGAGVRFGHTGSTPANVPKGP